MTYSLVARDPETGELGAAVESHFFSVGSVVTWAEPGIGAVATQAFAEPAYGPRGLALIRAGRSAVGALGELVDRDSREATRQVAMIDAAGRVAVHTGRSCIPEAGHRVGAQMSAQANMMRREGAPGAMVEAYETATGELADKLLAALDAAEREGGDVRGRQSAALVVVGGKRTDAPWEQRPFDLRVEDHSEPLHELRRLVELKRAYDRMEEGEQRVMAGDFAAAVEHYQAAREAAPDNLEIAFWLGLSLAGAGRIDEGQAQLRRVCAAHDGWGELLRRLPNAGLLPDDPELLRALLPE
ncbi:MAG TPA: DUF1028 domain-containing protein [Solirubrobacterales bacterium]|jgi:uncharacterized Ntn-hydrolase superfamily protein|nr:DUF1028 domain-containing protein [Solirubrobacterales bacterium]